MDVQTGLVSLLVVSIVSASTPLLSALLPENAAALVGAGVLSVVVFPGLAMALKPRGATQENAKGLAEVKSV